MSGDILAGPCSPLEPVPAPPLAAHPVGAAQTAPQPWRGACPHVLPSRGHCGQQPVAGLCSHRRPPRPPSLQLPSLWLLAELFRFADSSSCVSGRGWKESCFSHLTGLLLGESGGTTSFSGKGLKEAGPGAGKTILHRGVGLLGFRSQLHPLPAVWPWATYLTSLGFSFQGQLIFLFLINVL